VDITKAHLFTGEVRKKKCTAFCRLLYSSLSAGEIKEKITSSETLSFSYKDDLREIHYCGGSYIVILNIFISHMCLAEYGGSEAIYITTHICRIRPSHIRNGWLEVM